MRIIDSPYSALLLGGEAVDLECGVYIEGG
jgi:hypothetical protein